MFSILIELSENCVIFTLFFSCVGVGHVNYRFGGELSANPCKLSEHIQVKIVLEKSIL